MSETWADYYWLNGKVVTKAKGVVSLADRGLTLGDGLFETMLWTGERLRFFDDHMARLAHGATFLGLPLALTPEALEAQLTAFCERTKGEMAAVRLTLTRGLGPRGLGVPEIASPQLFASLAPISQGFAPVALQTVSVPRNAGAPSARFKTLSYIDNIAALAEARAKGADDGVMLNAHGQIACATSANVVALVNGDLLTPPVEAGALPGIIRGRLIRSGLVKATQLSREDLRTVEALFLTNSLVGVRSVSSIDERSLDQRPDLRAQLIDSLQG